MTELSHGEISSILAFRLTPGSDVLLSISDESGNAYGGHMQPGCEVLLTTDIVIGEFSGINMARRFDTELGVPLFSPRSK